MNVRLMAVRDHFFKSLCSPAGQCKRRSAAGRVHNPDIFHVNAALKSGADRFAERFLGGETFGVGSRNSEGAAARFGAFDLGEDAVSNLSP